MTRTFVLLLLIATPLNAFNFKSDVDWAYRHGNWNELELLITPILFPDHHRHRFHSEAGQLHFRLGVALWHQGKWQKAVNCFEIFYKRYSKSSPVNRLQALLGWSDCAHRLGDYGLSVRMAKKFRKEAPPREWQRKSPFANGPKIFGFNPYFGVRRQSPKNPRPTPAPGS